MKLSGKEHIEIAHDVLAAKVYEEASPLERQRLEAERLVRDSFRQFKDRGKMLDRSDLRVIQPVKDRLDLQEEEWAYIDRSRNRIRARIGLLIGSGLLVLLLVGFLWDTSRREAVQRRMAEANRLVYLANYYADNQQLDSALLFAGAAYDLTSDDPLPAAQRILTGAFHQGFEGIPLRQNQFQLPGILEQARMLPHQKKALLVDESGRMSLFDLVSGQEQLIYQGEYLTNFSFDLSGERILFNEEDTIISIRLDAPDEPIRLIKSGILVQLAYWPEAEGIVAVTEDSIVVFNPGQPDGGWRTGLPDANSFISHSAINPDASLLAVAAANDSIYHWDAGGLYLGSFASPGPLVGLAVTLEDNSIVLTDSLVQVQGADGGQLAMHHLPALPEFFYEPEFVGNPSLSDKIYLNMGRSLLSMEPDGSDLDTLTVFDALHEHILFSPERHAAVDFSNQQLLSTETLEGRRLMTLPPFDDLDYDDATRSLLMIKDHRLTWWQFSFGPFEERKQVQSFFLPTQTSSGMLTVEDGRVFKRSDEAAMAWEEVVFPEPIAYTSHHPVDGAIIGLALSGKLYRFTDSVTEVIHDFGAGKEWLPFISNDRLLAFRDKTNANMLIALDGNGDLDTLSYDGVLHKVAFSPKNGNIGMAGSGNDAILWTPAGDTLVHLADHSRDVLDISFSPDGTLVATASGDHTARLWDLRGQLLHVFSGHDDFVNALVFSPDGNSVLTASSDRSLKRWDTASGRLLYSFLGHEDQIRGTTFSPDGESILSWSDDGTARLWNLEGEPLSVYRQQGYQDPISRAEFSPDGSRVITLSESGELRIWLIPSEVNRWLRSNYGPSS